MARAVIAARDGTRRAAPAMRTLVTERLTLEPLVVAHADAMVAVLGDPALYRFLDHGPPSLAELRERYARLEARRSGDGRDDWLNWIVVASGLGPIGFVQATLEDDGANWIAYLLGRAAWGRGYAREAVRAMVAHLGDVYGAHRLLAMAEVDNAPSIALLRALDFRDADRRERGWFEMTASERLFVRDAPAGTGMS